jgi:hypothetical protein
VDKLRLLKDTIRTYGFNSGHGVFITKLGNTQLRPERSAEIEGGFDAELWGNRLKVQVTHVRKETHDALVDMQVAGSVYGGGSISTNVGLIRNMDTEVSMQAQLLQGAALSWSIGTSVSHNSNRVIRLAPGQKPIVQSNSYGTQTRIVAGYPLFGRWAFPIVNYYDINEDGQIGQEEILLGDSLVYVGRQDPNYELSLNTDLSLGGRLSAHALVHYTNGLTQFNAAGQGMSYGQYNPTAPLGTQAASIAYCTGGAGCGNNTETGYGLIQTVNILRFQSLSLNYSVPAAFARRVGAQSMSVVLQGSNLGLHTNYRGKDPNVNAYATGNQTADTGQLPEPRTWAISVHLGY